MKYIAALLFLLTSDFAFSQVHILQTLDLSEGKWELFVTAGEGTEEEMKPVKNRYTHDTKIIADLLRNLIISTDSQSTGFSHYTESLYLVKNGKKVQRISLYNTLGKVNIDDHYFNYDPDVFYKKMEELKEIPSAQFTVRNRESALRLREYLQAQSGVFFPEWDTLWVSFPGRLSYRVSFDSVSPYPGWNADTLSGGKGKDKVFLEVSPANDSQSLINPVDWELLERTRLNFMKDKIASDLNLSPENFALSYYMTDENGREYYYFYSNEGPGILFKAFELIQPWQKTEDIPFVVYGLSLKEIDRIIKKLERGN